MAAHHDMQIPVIDMQVSSGLTEKIVKASEEWGSFRIVNHGVPLKLMSEMKVVGRSLLELPTEIKLRNCHPIEHQGYTLPNKMKQFLEGLSIYDITNANSAPIDHFVHQLDASLYQREVISNYYVAVSELTNDLLRTISEGLGVAGDRFKDCICQMKINRYNYSTETVGLAGAVMHTDPGLLTVLRDDEVIGGLEIEHNFTGEWVSADPIPGSFVVIIGDCGKAWSNGRFLSGKHRVQCYEPQHRISVLYFVQCPRDRKIETPKELIDSQHPQLYIPFDYRDYYHARTYELTCERISGGALEVFRASKGEKSKAHDTSISGYEAPDTTIFESDVSDKMISETETQNTMTFGSDTRNINPD